jgi:hypothetical protein
MNPRHVLSLGNRAMAVSGSAMLLGVGAAYPFAHHFGLLPQVLAHLAIPVAAGVFKLGYVMRLAGQHELAAAGGAAPGQACGSRRKISTRRFCARPASLALSATG